MRCSSRDSGRGTRDSVADVLHRAPSPAPRVPTLVALLLALFGCEVPAPVAPDLQPGIVLFGVLDPGSTEQIVLLMQSRASVPDVSTISIVPNDPIVSSGETPITGARVVLYGPAGDSAVAVEDRVSRSDHLGAGVYRLVTSGDAAFAPPGDFLPLVAGSSYRLHVTSTLGEADASTLVPSVDRVVSGPTHNVVIGRDSVLLTTSAARAAGYVYSLRASNGTSTEGDQQFRRDLERRLILATGDDWAFAFARDRLRTGTRHVLTVTAADSNYFAYYGAQADPFADRTLRTSLRGAAGVFGSVLVIAAVPIAVVQGP
jgi:hypothetical protein